MSSRRFLIAAALLLVTVGGSGTYAVHAFPLLAGDEILAAPSAPVIPSVPLTISAPAPAVSEPVVAAPKERQTSAPIWLELKDADLPATLRVIVEHGGRTANVDPSIAGKVTVSLNNVPWDQALAFVLRANRLKSTTQGNTIRIAPSAEPPAAAPAVAHEQQPPTTSVRIEQTPKVIRQVNPTYPVEAMRAGIEGSVEVELMIGDDGTVSHARVVRSSDPIFDQAAVNAAEQWLFAKPSAGPVVRTVELNFTLRAGATRRMKVGANADTVRIGGTIKAPIKLKHVSPLYPEIARTAAVKGVVILEVLIDREGRVTDAEVLRSIPLLDQAAKDAVMQWAFTPTLMNGNSVPVIMTVMVNFNPEQ